jgi:peptide/nickel transport system ATP-binding protein
MAVLEVKDLMCSFRNGSAAGFRSMKHAVLKGVSFTVEERCSLGLIGDSGSGKSTIARCVAGLTRPEAGTITVMGNNVYPDVRGRRALRGKIQMLFQDHTASLDPVMTVRDTIAEGVRAQTGTTSVDEGIIHRLLLRVGLKAGVGAAYPRQLSGGERQRVALARALSVDPALLVLDEPTSSLDAGTQRQIFQLVESIQEDRHTAILFISHDIASIVRLCDRIAVLFDGRVVEYGPTASILAHPMHAYTKQIAALHAQRGHPL